MNFVPTAKNEVHLEKTGRYVLDGEVYYGKLQKGEIMEPNEKHSKKALKAADDILGGGAVKAFGDASDEEAGTKKRTRSRYFNADSSFGFAVLGDAGVRSEWLQELERELYLWSFDQRTKLNEYVRSHCYNVSFDCEQAAARTGKSAVQCARLIYLLQMCSQEERMKGGDKKIKREAKEEAEFDGEEENEEYDEEEEELESMEFENQEGDEEEAGPLGKEKEEEEEEEEENQQQVDFDDIEVQIDFDEEVEDLDGQRKEENRLRLDIQGDSDSDNNVNAYQRPAEPVLSLDQFFHDAVKSYVKSLMVAASERPHIRREVSGDDIKNVIGDLEFPKLSEKVNKVLEKKGESRIQGKKWYFSEEAKARGSAKRKEKGKLWQGLEERIEEWNEGEEDLDQDEED